MQSKYNYTDIHIHSNFSWDAQQTAEDIVNKAVQESVEYIGISDHIDFPQEHRQPYNKFKYKKRLDTINKLKETFPELKAGFEVGEAHLYSDTYEKFIEGKDIDHVIGAVHMIGEYTPVYEQYFSQYDSYEDAYRRYFEEIFKLVSYGNFDILAHLDIVHRRGAGFYPEYKYETFKSDIDDILKVIIDKKIALEINTSGLRYFAKDILPNADIVKAYLDMGGDMISIGCDAHIAKDTFFGIDKAFEILDNLGAKETVIFNKRKPQKVSIFK